MQKEPKLSSADKAERDKKRLSLPPPSGQSQSRDPSPNRKGSSPSRGTPGANIPVHKFSFDDEPPIAQPYLSTKPTFIGAEGETEDDNPGSVTFRKLIQRRRPTHSEPIAKQSAPLENVALRKVSLGAEADRAAEAQMNSVTPPSQKLLAMEGGEPLEQSEVGRRARQVGSMLKNLSRTILPIGEKPSSQSSQAVSGSTGVSPSSNSALLTRSVTSPNEKTPLSVTAPFQRLTSQVFSASYTAPSHSHSASSSHNTVPSVSSPLNNTPASSAGQTRGANPVPLLPPSSNSATIPNQNVGGSSGFGKSSVSSASSANASSTSSGIERGVRGLFEKLARRDRAQQALEPEGAAKKGCFGVPLTSVDTCWVRDESIPAVLAKMCAFLAENRAAETEGIFRVAGRSSDIALIREHFDRGGDLQSVLAEKAASLPISSSTGSAPAAVLDVHSVAGAVKLWFKLLPDPIFSFAVYPKWMAAQQIESDEKRLTRLWEILQELPALNRTIILFTVRFLRSLADARDHTLMTSSSLGTIMGSLMLRNNSVAVAESPLSDVMAFQRAGQVLRNFIDHIEILSDHSHPPDFSANGAGAESILRSQGGSLIARPGAADTSAKKLALLPRLDIPVLEGNDAFQHDSPRRPRMGQIASTAPQPLMAGGAIAPPLNTHFSTTIDDHDTKPKFPLRPLPAAQPPQIRNIQKAVRSLRDELHLPRNAEEAVAMSPEGFWRKCFFVLVLAMIAARVSIRIYRNFFGE